MLRRAIAILFVTLAATTCAPPQETRTPDSVARAAPRLWVISVGVSGYAKREFSLKFADKDAITVYDFFGSEQGSAVPEGRRFLLVNEKASRADVLTQLQEVAERAAAAENDVVIVFLALHALGGNGDPFYFMSYDTDPSRLLATGISDSDVQRALSRAKRVVLLLDTCHAGSFGFDNFGNKRALRAERTKELLNHLAELRGTGVLAASGQNEYSEEDPRWGGGHGVFTYYLLEGLQGNADQDGDGVITLTELYEYVYDPIKKDRQGNQHPYLAGNGNLPVVATPRDPEASGDPITQLKTLNTNLKRAVDNFLRPIQSTDGAIEAIANIPRDLAAMGVKVDRKRLMAEAHKILNGEEADIGSLGLEDRARQLVEERFDRLKRVVREISRIDENFKKLNELIANTAARVPTIGTKAIYQVDVVLHSPVATPAVKRRAEEEKQAVTEIVEELKGNLALWQKTLIELPAKAKAAVASMKAWD